MVSIGGKRAPRERTSNQSDSESKASHSERERELTGSRRIEGVWLLRSDGKKHKNVGFSPYLFPDCSIQIERFTRMEWLDFLWTASRSMWCGT